MTVPPGAITAAARAWCLKRYTYDGAYTPGGRERHIAADAESTATHLPLLTALEAAYPLIVADVLARLEQGVADGAGEVIAQARAEGAAAERDRIAALANQVVATYRVRDGSRHARIRPFADLLDGEP